MNISKIAATAAILAGVALTAIGGAPLAEAKSKSGIVSDSDVGPCEMGSWQPGCKPFKVKKFKPPHHHHHNDWRVHIWLGPDPWFNDPWYYGPAYNYTSPYYDDDYDVQFAMTCNAAKGFLRSQGYHNVKAKDCDGRYYSFTATKKGHKYRIRLNAYTGRYTRAMI